MRAVLDTNVLVSAVLSSGPPFRIYQSWLDGAFDLVTSGPLVAELERVMARPRIAARTGWPTSRLRAFLAALEDRALRVEPKLAIDRIRDDPSDNRVLEAAAEATTDYIVTGDGHLLALGQHDSTEIITPARFLAVLAAEQPRP